MVRVVVGAAVASAVVDLVAAVVAVSAEDLAEAVISEVVAREAVGDADFHGLISRIFTDRRRLWLRR